MFSRCCVLSLLVLAVSAQAQAPRTDKRLKMRIAVAPIDWTNREWIDSWSVPVQFRDAINEKLAKRLLDTGRFVVLEREAMTAILDEKAIKEENTGQSQRGKIVPAQALIRPKMIDFTLARRGSGAGVNIGGIGRVGGGVAEAQCGINIRIFNVDTSELIAAEEAAGKASSSNFNFSGNHRVAFADFATFENSPLGSAVSKAIEVAVEKIVRKLDEQPWSARIADYDEDSREITLNAGSELGVRTGDVFEIHRVGRTIRDPETGEVLGVRTSKAGRIRVTDVEKKLAIAVILEGEAPKVGDIVRESR
jgi:curli biogenesis system outer membrane secretion channel CsgG